MATTPPQAEGKGRSNIFRPKAGNCPPQPPAAWDNDAAAGGGEGTIQHPVVGFFHFAHRAALDL